MIINKLLAATIVALGLSTAPSNAAISDVLNNTSFYSIYCTAQAAGNLTSVTLWNPVGSGVVVSLVRSSTWSSLGTQFNLKRTATLTGFGVDRGVRNSKYFPGVGGTIAQSHAHIYALGSGTTPAANAFEVYGDSTEPHVDEYPFTMGPGEGLVLIPDTTGATNWCWSLTFVETPTP